MSRVVITYCTQCRWLLRASWLAQELLTTFSDEITELVLRPGKGGVLRVEVGPPEHPETLWDRAVDGGFPELNALKRAVRDRVAPGRKLGHVDRVADPAAGPGAAPEAES